jgi:Carboxypeptidase regulatory-like domain
MKKRILPFVLLLFVLASCKNFGDPITRIKVTVKDAQGNALENATVSLFETLGNEARKADIDKLTTSNGTYEVSLIGSLPQTYWLVIKKEGFKSLKKDLNLEKEKENIVDVVLEKE